MLEQKTVNMELKLSLAILFLILETVLNYSTAQPVPFIVGGFTVDIKQYPYQVSMIFDGQHQCGASIIHKRFILTAAHCVEGVSSNITIRAGSSLVNEGGTIYNVVSVYIHPLFASVTFDYDIALLEIDEHIIFDDTRRPVRLASNKLEILDGTVCQVSGWGRLYQGGPYSLDLQATTVNIVNRDTCQSQYLKMPFYEAEITERMTCASAMNRDACSKDSGGPLVCTGRQVGIVSWGYGCAQPNFSGVYAKIQILRNFVHDTINDWDDHETMKQEDK